MGCNVYLKYETAELTKTEFRAHLENCAECREKFRKDVQIMSIARDLNRDIKAPDLWKKLETEIKSDETITVKPAVKKTNLYNYLLYAAAAIVLIVIGISLKSTQDINDEGLRLLSKNALNSVINSEKEYISAIEKLEEFAEQEIQQIDPQLSDLYRTKLETIDRQINKCRTVLDQNPANRHMRRYLLAALQDKKNTLQQIINFQG